MGTMREKRPGSWELRVYIGDDSQGRPMQRSRACSGCWRRVHAVWVIRFTPLFIDDARGHPRSGVDALAP